MFFEAKPPVCDEDGLIDNFNRDRDEDDQFVIYIYGIFIVLVIFLSFIS